MPRLERRAAHVVGAADLIAGYQVWLAVDRHGSRAYRNAAGAFLGRWPDPAGFADEPLATQVSVTVSQRPFVTYLMVTGRLRPGYDYLARKIGGLLAQAGRGPLAADLASFTAAATDPDYSGHSTRCSAGRIIVRLLIQTGRPLPKCPQATSTNWPPRCADATTRPANPPPGPTTAPSSAQRTACCFTSACSTLHPRTRGNTPACAATTASVPEPLRTLFLDYCTQVATIKGIASHLARFGRFLASYDPRVTDLSMLDRPTIEGWLASLAGERHPDGTAMSI